MHVDPLMLEPALKAAHGTLGLHSPAAHRGCPDRQTDQSRLHQADHHPGPCLEVPQIQPVLMLVSHFTHGRIETRRAFHVYPSLG